MGLRRQAVVLVLVGLATLTVVHVADPQDWTRIELTRSLALHGSLQVPADLPIDKAIYGGHTYADKAPGMSVLAIPAFEVERALGVAKPRAKWDSEGDLSVWGLRLGAGGILFLLTVWLVMQAAGTAAGATFGAGTLAGAARGDDVRARRRGRARARRVPPRAPPDARAARRPRDSSAAAPSSSTTRPP